MSTEINRSSTNFCYAFGDSLQLESWLRGPEFTRGIAFAGRSNVGKSSCINALFGQKTARISKTPGRTREVNVFSFQLMDNETNFFLFDLPGHGHAEVSKKVKQNWEELMFTFFENASDTLLVNIQDARHPNQKSDLLFNQYLEQFPLDSFICFNKMDKLKTQKERAVLEKLRPQLYKSHKHAKQIHFVSAETKTGIEPLETALASWLLRP